MHNMPTSQPRYYAYGDVIGRMRIPPTPGVPNWNAESDAIAWAAAHGAANVVREEGPASKPTAITFVWKRSDDPNFVLIDNQIWDLISDHFPDATVGQVGKLAKAIIELLPKER